MLTLGAQGDVKPLTGEKIIIKGAPSRSAARKLSTGT